MRARAGVMRGRSDVVGSLPRWWHLRGGAAWFHVGQRTPFGGVTAKVRGKAPPHANMGGSCPLLTRHCPPHLLFFFGVDTPSSHPIFVWYVSGAERIPIAAFSSPPAGARMLSPRWLGRLCATSHTAARALHTAVSPARPAPRRPLAPEAATVAAQPRRARCPCLAVLAPSLRFRARSPAPHTHARRAAMARTARTHAATRADDDRRVRARRAAARRRVFPFFRCPRCPAGPRAAPHARGRAPLLAARAAPR
jgi:hypothetical protein